MTTRRGTRKADAVVKQDMTPMPPEVRRSSRRVLGPKRLRYSSDHPSPQSPTKKKTKQQLKNIPMEREVSKKDNSDVENSDSAHTSGINGLSEYELERLENIRHNQEFLSSINLFKLSDDFKQSKRPKPPQRGLRSQSAVKIVQPSRKSLRLQNKEAIIVDLPTSPPTAMKYYEQSEKKPPGPLLMVPVNMDEGSKLPPELLELCSDVTMKEKKMGRDLKEYRTTLSSMRITEDTVAKVVKSRIFSATFHPCATSLLVAAGDKQGNIGLWNVGGDWADDGVLLFEPHSRPVNCLAFSKTHPAHLLSSSYDGSLRCMDIEKAVFDDVYDIEEGLKTFDFMSPDCSTLVVGNIYGEVAIVDRRTPGHSHESLHTLDSSTVRCVSVHPLQQQYFAVAESKIVSIYDSRILKKTSSKPVSQLHGHLKSISSCYFSPVSGNRVLTTCLDNHIRIYDSSAVMTTAPLLLSKSINLHTGRWLSKIVAVWDTKQEDCFVVGSMLRPRRVDVLHESGRLQHSYQDTENLTTVLSVTAFHPTRNALLGGNGSGRIHVFSD